jgi:hypothetical protein
MFQRSKFPAPVSLATFSIFNVSDVESFGFASDADTVTLEVQVWLALDIDDKGKQLDHTSAAFELFFMYMFYPQI